MRREMSALRVTLEPVTRKRVAPGDAAIEVVVVNSGDKPEFFHEYQAQHASLVLQLEDPSGKRLLLPPPPPPDERDLGPPSRFAPGQSIRLRYVGLVDARRGSGRYRVRWFSRDEGLGGSREAPLESEWIALEVGRSEVSQLPPRSPFAHLVFAAWTLVRSSVLIVGPRHPAPVMPRGPRAGGRPPNDRNYLERDAFRVERHLRVERALPCAS